MGLASFNKARRLAKMKEQGGFYSKSALEKMGKDLLIEHCKTLEIDYFKEDGKSPLRKDDIVDLLEGKVRKE